MDHSSPSSAVYLAGKPRSKSAASLLLKWPGQKAGMTIMPSEALPAILRKALVEWPPPPPAGS